MDSVCQKCFHACVCEEFNADRAYPHKRCAYANDHFVYADRLGKLAAADRDGRVVVLPFTVGDTVDRLFSHNEVIALWYDKPDDKDYSYLLWRGMAWEIPEEYRNLAFLRIKGIVPETIDKADTINIQVPPYVIPCAEAEAALKEQEKQK